MKTSLYTLLITSSVAIVTTWFGMHTMHKNDAVNYEYMKQRLEVAKAFTVEVMEAMPAEAFTYKPNEDVRSFGAQAYHIAYSTEWFHSSLKGAPIQWAPGDEDRMNKEALIAYTKEQFDAITKTIVNQEQSDRFTDGVIGFLDHNAHHRGQMVSYLRMKGIAPPNYR